MSVLFASSSGAMMKSASSASSLSTAVTVKSSKGRVYGYHVENPNGAKSYVQFFDHAAPTVGTTSAVLRLFVPANGGLDMVFPLGIQFETAITYACTTTATGTTGPTVGLVVNVLYC